MARGVLFRHIGLAGMVLAAVGVQCSLHGQTAQPVPAVAQTPGSPSILPDQSRSAAEPPGAIYKDAMRPLDLVRGSLENWSDAELGVLSVGMHKAKDACEQVKPESYSGDDLYDLARLCSFGQDWNAANTSALDYVASGLEAHRAQAYALSINALVHINGVDLATQTAQEMLRKLPYDAEVAYAVRYMKDNLEQAGNPAALTLAVQEHAAIVQALGPGVPLKATHGDAMIGVGALYESAMELAFLQRYSGDDAAAASTATEVEGALQKSVALSAEDRQRVDGVTTQYGLLGAHVPAIEASRSLLSPTAKARINPDFGAATVLVLFPDWCVQCRKMMRTLTEFAKVNAGTPLHAYGLVFADTSMITDSATHEGFLQELQGTSTFLVPADTPQTFGAQEFPLAIAIDSAGVARF